MELIIEDVRQDYIDYGIFSSGTRVGVLQTVESGGSAFIRHIHVEDGHKRNGYAGMAVRELVEEHLSVRFCITGHSASAFPFWMAFMEKCREDGMETRNVRGDIWEIRKER